MDEQQMDKMTIAVCEERIKATEEYLRSAILELNKMLGREEGKEKKSVQSLNVVELATKIKGISELVAGLYKYSELQRKKVLDVLAPLVNTPENDCAEYKKQGKEIVKVRDEVEGAIVAAYKLKLSNILVSNKFEAKK